MSFKHLLLVCGCLVTVPALAESRTLDDRMHHLRMDGPAEWAEFPAKATADRLRISFRAEANAQPQTLRLRQQDVKQDWVVRLNETEIDRLIRDENDLLEYFSLPAGTLVAGDNTLVVEQVVGGRSSVDDIRVGEIRLDSRPPAEVLSETTLSVTVIDADSGQPLPARLTMLDEHQTLQTVQVEPSQTVAVRPGTIYTANGQARCTLPAGRYMIYAGRGFEYSLASEEVHLRPGESLAITLTIGREVPTEGYVACDTHIHTRTHSGHGDATVEERMVTIAGEGIELPIATDHNVPIDHKKVAAQVGVRQYFTPVVGNEVTTPVGHFNIFPVDPQATPPDHRLRNWPEIFDEIERASAAPIVILNHARDLHSGFRPFGPPQFNDVVASNVDGWPMRFNAMEVINSGATQSNVLQLVQDWMALLNRGVSVTPVGSSDSHDVLRHFVGQGRTYIRCEDRDPAAIDLAEAVGNFRDGRVMVSYGLLAEIRVDGYRSGETAPISSETLDVDLRVLGPHWVKADQIELFMNGRKVHEQKIGGDAAGLPRGVKWQGQLRLPKPGHDVHLVAIARGPGLEMPYWKTAKPYQPTTPDWQSQTIGCSGAIWIDADGDGKRSSARDYAERVWQDSGGRLSQLLAGLESYDEAVAAHAAELFQTSGNSLTDTATQAELQRAAPAMQAGFHRYFQAWRATQLGGAATP